MSINPDRPQFLHVPTGQIVFPDGYPAEELEALPHTYWAERDLEASIAAVKAEAARQILEVAPLWKQLNDIREPTPEGDARLAAIDAIRAQSNTDEALIREKSNG